MKFAIQSGKPDVDSRREASSSSIEGRRPSFSSYSMCPSLRETIGNPFGMSTFAGVQESTSSDKAIFLDVKSPNLMYWEISMRKVVVQSCIIGLFLSRHVMQARSVILPFLTDRSIMLISVLHRGSWCGIRTRSIPGINKCRMGTRYFAPG